MAYLFLQDGFKRLEGVCRDFLWSYTKEGTPKKVLVAWEDVTFPKAEGVLGIIAFSKHAMVLRMRWVTALFNQEDL